jgi:inhibitor of KinA sporulation pathway (predicted exonuclease)
MDTSAFGSSEAGVIVAKIVNSIIDERQRKYVQHKTLRLFHRYCRGLKAIREMQYEFPEHFAILWRNHVTRT